MKKMIACLIVVTVILSLTACGGTSNTNPTYSDDTVTNRIDSSDLNDSSSHEDSDNSSSYHSSYDSNYHTNSNSGSSGNSESYSSGTKGYDYDKGYGYTSPKEGESLSDYIKRQDPELYKSMQDNYKSLK